MADELSTLIPLDGTVVSEQALGLLPFLRSIGVTTVSLTSVWEEKEPAPRHLSKQDAEERGMTYLNAYHAAISQRLEPLSLKVRSIIRIGSATEELLRVLRETNPDLIVMSTGAKSKDDMAGEPISIAEKIISNAPCPTMVLGPGASIALDSDWPRRILVPLDGTVVSEVAAGLGRYLASLAGAALGLIRVVHLPQGSASTHDDAGGALLQRLAIDAEEYLLPLGQRLSANWTVLRCQQPRDVAGTIVERARADQADLLVLVSHSREDALPWMMGSVAKELLRSKSPVLVVRPGQERTSRLIQHASAVNPAING